MTIETPLVLIDNIIVQICSNTYNPEVYSNTSALKVSIARCVAFILTILNPRLIIRKIEMGL
jgi:hypothetical protein